MQYIYRKKGHIVFTCESSCLECADTLFEICVQKITGEITVSVVPDEKWNNIMKGLFNEKSTSNSNHN
jgi:hypothetical protein